MGGYLSGRKKDSDSQGAGDRESEAVKNKRQWRVVRCNRELRIQDLPSELRSLFVLRRTSSMFFDEDGDLAHEFYHEEKVVNKSGVVRWGMRRIGGTLTPQGEVDLPIPRLHVDLPIILLDSNATIVPVES